MKEATTASRLHTSRIVLAFLLGLAIAGPLLSNASSAGVPEWVGGVIAVAGLVGALLVFWREGALRGTFVVLFLVAIASAAALGWFLRGHTQPLVPADVWACWPFLVARTACRNHFGAQSASYIVRGTWAECPVFVTGTARR